MKRAFEVISRLAAHHRIVIAMLVAAAIESLLHGRVASATQWITTWDVFALCVLALAWLTITTTPRDKIRLRAQKQDLGHTVIFIFIIVAACAGLFAVVFLFRTNKHEPGAHSILHLVSGLLAIVFSWLLVHTVFGLRYAHTFYGDDDDPKTKNAHAGGLDFPGNAAPDYMDFAYFSFVIGMTFQVSDVQITSRVLRRVVLVHGMLSFAFNTVILALTINTVSSLL